jgi:hypothetical protein
MEQGELHGQYFMLGENIANLLSPDERFHRILPRPGVAGMVKKKIAGNVIHRGRIRVDFGRPLQGFTQLFDK